MDLHDGRARRIRNQLAFFGHLNIFRMGGQKLTCNQPFTFCKFGHIVARFRSFLSMSFLLKASNNAMSQMVSASLEAISFVTFFGYTRFGVT